LEEIALLSVMYPVGVGASGSTLPCCHKLLVHYQIKTECITKSLRNGDRELPAGSCRKVKENTRQWGDSKEEGGRLRVGVFLGFWFYPVK
jgi:hypothetical protein